MNREQILRAIPHRDPFLLVDAVVEQDESRIVCTKTFSGKEDFFAGHYPGYPLVPGVLLCEAAMQAGAILLPANPCFYTRPRTVEAVADTVVARELIVKVMGGASISTPVKQKNRW